jgi:DNA-directed RNA polymerase specialized sigma24 family protein
MGEEDLSPANSAGCTISNGVSAWGRESMPGDWYPRPERFPTTRWSLVDRAGEAGPEAGRQALEQLLVRYLPALRTHLIFTKRLAPDDADDVLQDFVAGKILQRDLIARADQDLGKFRTFLLTALDRFLLNHRRQQGAKKRAASAAAALGDHAEQLADDGATDCFELAWARQVLAEAVRRMQAECVQSGRADVWAIFKGRVLKPIVDGEEPVEIDELVRRFGLPSAAQASNLLVTGKRMYARTLRSVVAEYARDVAEIEAEIGDLQQILARSPRRSTPPRSP